MPVVEEHFDVNERRDAGQPRWRLLAELGRRVFDPVDGNALGQRVAEALLELVSARSSVLFEVTGDEPPVLQAVAGELILHDVLDCLGTLVAEIVSAPAERRGSGELAVARMHGAGCVLALPLHVRDYVIGALVLLDGPERRFVEDELAVAQAFANQTAVALENRRLYAQLSRAVSAVETSQKQLVESERLHAVGELAAGVAHHLNNIMTVILGNVQLTLNDILPPAVIVRLRSTERAVLDATEVVRRMASFSRSEPLDESQEVDLNQVASDVLELTRARWQDEAQVHGLAIRARLEGGRIPSVKGDPTALREVLLNLVLNAVDALPSGGDILVLTWAAEGMVYCSVGDNGVGMTPDVRQRALEPFFTTKGFRCRGLGLSVSYGIVQRHHGTLSLDTADGHGTTVTIALPAVSGDASTTGAAGTRASGVTVLVIDDDAAVRDIMAQILRCYGHTVLVASNGRDGLAQLGPELDLVITDLGMPGMTGWDVVDAVKRVRSDLAVLLLTGWGDHPHGQRDGQAAPDAVLAKPLTQDKLAAVVAELTAARATRARSR